MQTFTSGPQILHSNRGSDLGSKRVLLGLKKTNPVLFYITFQYILARRSEEEILKDIIPAFCFSASVTFVIFSHQIFGEFSSEHTETSNQTYLLQAARDCGSAYLTKWGNSRFATDYATVTLHITLSPVYPSPRSRPFLMNRLR